MIYRLRIILDTKEDVIRDIEIKSTNTFEDLHFAIVNAFGFEGNEMASFYLSNSKWNQGEELTFESFGDEKVMKEHVLDTLINNDQKNFIYVYDFLKLWTCFIEVVETNNENSYSHYPQTIFSIGETPIKAPEKLFVEDNNDKYSEDNIEEEDPCQFY